MKKQFVALFLLVFTALNAFASDAEDFKKLPNEAIQAKCKVELESVNTDEVRKSISSIESFMKLLKEEREREIMDAYIAEIRKTSTDCATTAANTVRLLNEMAKVFDNTSGSLKALLNK